jgi:hypothetical protein
MKKAKPTKQQKSEVKVAGEAAQPHRLETILFDGLLVADNIKYNLYLLSKSIIFASAFSHTDYDEAIKIANNAIRDLDLVSKTNEKNK